MINVLRAGAALALAALVCVGPMAAATATQPTAVELGGAPVTPSTDPRNPRLLTAGVWADVLGAAELPDGTHEFAYRRTMTDSTIHLGVVGAPSAPDGGEALSISASAPDGADGRIECGGDQSTSSYPVTQRLLGVGVTIGSSDLGVRDSGCLSADQVTFSVDRYTSSATTDLPIAIRVVEEAPVEDTATDLPTASESPRVDVPDTAAPTSLSGTPSFDDAPMLDPGMTYADAVPQGGTRLYRVHVGWGQALAVRVDVPAQDPAAAATLELAEPDVELSLLDPLRDVFSGEVEPSVGTGSYAVTGMTRLVEGTAPVRYLNRFADVAGSVPGDYWVAVAAESAAEGVDPVDVPFTLVADVTGSPAGDPTYPATVQSPGGDAGPAGYAADTPYLLADNIFAPDVAGDATSVGLAPPGSSARDHARLAAGILLGAVSLGCCAAGVTLVRRRPSPE